MLRKSTFLASIFAAFIVTVGLPGGARGQFVEGAARAGDLPARFRIIPSIT